MLQNKLRQVQDSLRNAGWRIQWIPWWEPGKPQVINSKNPIPLLGIVLIVGAIIWNQSIPLMVLGFAIIMLGIIISAYQIQAGWVRVNAKCVDLEIREFEKEVDELSSHWGFRMLCEFSFEGKEYRVTPEHAKLVSCNSKKQVEKYLGQHISDTGECYLWINPKNPLQTIFPKKRWWV